MLMNQAPVLTRLRDDSEVPVLWYEESSLTGYHELAGGAIETRHGLLTSGKSAGLEVIWINTGAARTVLLPGRGMGIWQIEAGGLRFGWKSPIDGPVHPCWVPIHDPDGLGWLEGFDELVVRCGLESNGAPEKGADGSLRYPLHGRIANLPATGLTLEIDHESGKLAITGDVIESKLFFKRLRLRSRIEFSPNSTRVDWVDSVTNELSMPTTVQMLYHINLGAPVLGPGARVIAPLETLAPKDDLSAVEIDTWDQIGGPQSGYAERVYFSGLSSRNHADSAVMLRGADGGSGLGVRIDTRSLPHFILWKNTAAESDGYVIGLEPATNFPNSRSREAQRGRVVMLGGGETVQFRVGLEPLVNGDQVQRFERLIGDLRGPGPLEIRERPDPNW